MALLPITDALIADYVLYCEGARDIEQEPMPFSQWRDIETEVRADFETEQAAKVCPVFRHITHDPVEGQRAGGPNGKPVVFRAGRWVHDF